MLVLPVITFLQDVFSAVKGPYHRKIGRHTQRFCSRAVKRSTNEMQKKVFFITAICADELIASLIGVDNKRQVAAFKGRTLKAKIAKKQITMALRVYMSGILTLISSHKELFLQQINMEEQQLLQTWCQIFDYVPSDMKLFDEVLLPTYRQGGIKSLSMSVGENILQPLFLESDGLSSSEMECLECIMVEDAAAVVHALATKKMEEI